MLRIGGNFQRQSTLAAPNESIFDGAHAETIKQVPIIWTPRSIDGVDMRNCETAVKAPSVVLKCGEFNDGSIGILTTKAENNRRPTARRFILCPRAWKKKHRESSGQTRSRSHKGRHGRAYSRLSHLEANRFTAGLPLYLWLSLIGVTARRFRQVGAAGLDRRYIHSDNFFGRCIK